MKVVGVTLFYNHTGVVVDVFGLVFFIISGPVLVSYR